MPAASPDQLAETLTSETLHVGYNAESQAIGESQPTVLTSPSSTVSRVRQTPAAPVVPLTETIPVAGGQQLHQFATMNQLMTGLGLWTGQAEPTGMQQASNTSQNPATECRCLQLTRKVLFTRLLHLLGTIWGHRFNRSGQAIKCHLHLPQPIHWLPRHSIPCYHH